MPNLVDVLHNDEGLADGFSVVDENRDLLVDRVHLQKKRTLVNQIFFFVLVLDSLFGQGYSDPHSEHARPEIQQNHLVRHCDLFSNT